MVGGWEGRHWESGRVDGGREGGWQAYTVKVFTVA